MSAQVRETLGNALFDATKVKNLALMEELLQRGANVNARDKRTTGDFSPSDKTPLYIAIEKKSLAAVRLLVSHGANVNAEIDGFDLRWETQERSRNTKNPFTDSLSRPMTDSLSRPVTPLDYAAYLNCSDIVPLLFRAGGMSWEVTADFDSDVTTPQAFLMASGANALETMPVLLDLYGKNDQAKNASGALWWAVENRQPKMVEFLVSAGANRKACEHGLEDALRVGDPEITALLVDSCDLRGSKGFWALLTIVTDPWREITSIQQLGIDPAQLSPAKRVKVEAWIVDYARRRQSAADLIRRIAAKGANLDSHGIGKTTLLLLAIANSNVLFTSALLDSGASPNLSIPGRAAPLRFLASHGKVRQLTDAINDSTIGTVSPNKQRELQLKVEARDLLIARVLVEKGADPTTGDNRYALGEAAWHGNNALVAFLLQKGADPNLVLVPTLPIPVLAGSASTESAMQLYLDRDLKVKNQTPLHMAARRGHLETVRQLLEAGAKANAQDTRGRNALHYLSAEGRSTLILAWEKRMSAIKDWQQNNALAGRNVVTPLPALQMAQLSKWASQGDAATVKLLIARGCDPNARDWRNQTPLRMALLQSDLAVVDALLAAGAKPSQTTSLFDVIEHGRRQRRALQALTKLRSDLIEADSRELWFSADKNKIKEHANDIIQAKRMRKTALWRRDFLLRQWGGVDAKVVARLLQNGADLNAKNRDGLTPVLLAARLGHAEVVRELIKAGADLKATNRNGETILAQISKYGPQTIKNLPAEFEHNTDLWFSAPVVKQRETFLRHTLRFENGEFQRILRSYGAR